MVEKSFGGQFFHFEKHHFRNFGVEIFPDKFKCCKKEIRGKTQVSKKMAHVGDTAAHWEVAHWMRSVYSILTDIF